MCLDNDHIYVSMGLMSGDYLLEFLREAQDKYVTVT